MAFAPSLNRLREFFLTGNTHDIEFRKQQLINLKNIIERYEDALYEALYADLKKSKEEAWITEIGLVISEINFFLKHIDGLTKPQKVGTNILNWPGKSYLVKEPLGVVLIIAPWNYPLQLSLIPLIGAIAAGNCVVLKPSEMAPATEKIIEKMIEECFNETYVKIITGDGASILPPLIRVFDFDHVFYTGSTTVGKHIYQLAAEKLIPVTLELGGKSPCVVTSKANLKLAAKRIVLGKFLNAGQTCIAPDYLLVHESVKNEFLDLIRQAIQNFYGQHPVESYDYGRIINSKQFDRLLGYLKNNKIVIGGTHNKELLYIAPTIIDAPPINSAIMQEEIFGPLLPILTYNEDAAALELIKHNPNPLAFYVFTQDKKEAQQWIQKVPSGGVCINAVAMHYLNKKLPFGGRGYSGIGNYHGAFSIATFSHTKALLNAAKWPDLPMAYPPFKGKLSLFKKIIK